MKKKKKTSDSEHEKNVSGMGYNGCIVQEYNEILQCNSHKALETTNVAEVGGRGHRVGGEATKRWLEEEENASDKKACA